MNERDSEEKIRDAFRRIWAAATNQPRQPGDRELMRIPVDKDGDADCIMHRALNELFELRARVFTVKDLGTIEFDDGMDDYAVPVEPESGEGKPASKLLRHAGAWQGEDLEERLSEVYATRSGGVTESGEAKEEHEQD